MPFGYQAADDVTTPFDPQADDVAAPELAVDGEIELCEIVYPARDLKVGADGPDVFVRIGRLAPIIFPLFHGVRRASG
jgi:hypothetical protein